MNYAEQILAIANDNNGVVTTTQVTKADIPREYLRILVDKGLLEHSALDFHFYLLSASTF